MTRVTVSFNPGVLARLFDVPLAMAAQEIGIGTVEHTVEKLSVPVERDFTGAVVVRSTEGQPPRKEDGILSGNVEYAVEDKDELVLITISASRPPESPGDDPNAAVILQEMMNRLITQNMDEYATVERCTDIVRDHLRRAL
ncbi:MAG: hypothetical protein WC069_06935 [Candidatus Shapirobacteria bacterium]